MSAQNDPETEARGRGVSRRAALGSIGLGALAGAAGGAGVYALQTRVSGAPGPDAVGEPAAATKISVGSWAAVRGDHYYIAHRGSGDVFPEHTMEAYQAAFQWGAKCLEVSVGRTSDNVLVCMHDASYDRTTTATGKLADLPSTILRGVNVRQARLGPAWLREPMPAVPLFEDVLRRFGGQVVLCVEPKDNLAYPLMVEMVERYGLKASVIFKLFYESPRIDEAKAAGYPVFVYLGRTADLVPSIIDPIVAKLDRDRDYLVIPAFGADAVTFTDDAIVQRCVATNVPVWVYPVHRRSDADHFFGLGVAGAICSSYGYVSRREPTATTDTWRYKAIASGEMTKDPASDAFALTWTGEDELTLGLQGAQHFVTLGQLCPLPNAKASYTIDFQARWTTMPKDSTSNITLAFGHTDDAYYEHRRGGTDGYHAIIRRDGRLDLFRHRPNNQTGAQLGSVQTRAPRVNEWMSFRLEVQPQQIRWSRLDGTPATVTTEDAAVRGGYLHVGRSALDGGLSLRQLRVS
ncbi:glycerophosphoryl diester phosphodiesterase [Microlunatus panaciterrae]|uniref:Glycerophosphoryl diester phosphodiesterase n=1 Tax=Microlunatus panaciterrae TaxID=400768 RepID=A0ABS2RIK5_9ACTN|nr:glycerophosphodiester phosphodiesterase [Microlunatus panaciterrae]MBM7798513.1 glycerophosphoryl diester phosphodiesterase [Microlunatus panaciterrae]